MSQEEYFYKGRPIEELSRKELLEALALSNRMLFEQHRRFVEFERTIRLKYRPKSLLGRFLCRIGLL